MTPQCRMLIFDFDGTLADTIPVCIAAVRAAALHSTGKTYSDAEIVSQFGLSEEGILQQLAGDNWEECLPVFETEYRNGHAGVSLFPGIAEVLTMLRQAGVEIAIVTGKGELTARISADHLNLRSYFDIIMTGSPERLVKADQIRELAARFGHDPARIAYVGDAVADITAAQQAGVVSVAAAWAAHVDKETLQRSSPDYFIESVDDFTSWVNEQCICPARGTAQESRK